MTLDRVSTVGRGARKWGGRALLLMAVAVLAFGASQVLSGRYQVHPVLTGSMRPGFSLGSVVVVKRVPAASLQVRDVLLFHKPTDPSQYVVHRIVSITDKGGARVIETKGDDNPVKDPWQFTLHGDTAYTAKFTIPYVGYAALWLHRPETRRYAIFGGALMLLIAAGSVLFKRDGVTPSDASSPEAIETPPLPALQVFEPQGAAAVFATCFAAAFQNVEADRIAADDPSDSSWPGLVKEPIALGPVQRHA